MEKNNQLTVVDNKVANERFMKVYKFLLDDLYKAIKIDAKLLYSFLSNKLYRVSKGQYKEMYKDEDGRPYVTFKRADLADALSCSIRKVTVLKKQLVEAGLIEDKFVGGGKENRIYINMPDVAKEYMYVDKKTNTKKYSFYKIPKCLFEEKRYQSMCNYSKMLYAVIEARYALSETNVKKHKIGKYVDAKGRVFCLFTNENLRQLLNISENTLIKAKKELIVLSLMRSEDISNSNNKRLYINTPSVANKQERKPEDVVLKNEVVEFPSKEYAEADNKHDKTLEVQNKKVSGAYYEVGVEQNMKPRYTVSSNTVKEYISNDMYDMYRDIGEQPNVFTNQSQQSQQSFPQDNIIDLNNAKKDALVMNLPEHLARYFKNYNVEDIEIIKAVMLKGKKSYNTKHKTDYSLEELEDRLLKTLKMLKKVMLDKKEDAKSLEPYYMQMVINAFKEHDQEIYGDRANYLSEEELKLVEEVEQKEYTDITDVKAMALKHMYFVRAES